MVVAWRGGACARLPVTRSWRARQCARRWAATLLSVASIAAIATTAGHAAVIEDPSGQPPTPHDCRAFLSAPALTPRHPIDADVLARVRDIGFGGDDGEGRSALALAPDGHALAFVMRRADPVRDRICIGLFVLPLTPNAIPRLIDEGGEPQLATIQSIGLGTFPTGVMQTVEPRWSPDGRTIAYLKRLGGHTAIWQVRADGGGASEAVSLASDIDGFVWSPDGSHLLVSSRPALLAANQAIDAEAKEGYLFDGRSFPLGTDRPIPIDDGEPVLSVVSLSTHQATSPTPEQARWMMPLSAWAPNGAVAIVAGPGGSLAWQAPDGVSAFTEAVITARMNGHVEACAAELCRGRLGGPWWSTDGLSLFFMRSGATEKGLTRFVRWTPTTGRVRSLATDDAAYADCITVGHDLICLREDSLTPLEIVRVDPETGMHHVLFDPNPEISGQFGGRIERLTWTVDKSTQSFGYLTLPPGYRPGDRLPLIVVQYRARGFQRGGVGDEAPILPLAIDGFAVLNVDRPEFAATHASIDAYMQAAMAGWQDERRALSSIETVVGLLVKRGLVDPERIGIHGMSAGAQSAQFAMIHSHLFRAASMSTCCKDPVGTMVEMGPDMRATQRRWGLAPIGSDNEQQWRDVSLAMNVDHIRTPILLQLSGWEFRAALETVAAFRDHDRPLELRIYPGDFHTKWQPAHRLAVYHRNIDWFDFWLKDRENVGPGKEEQYVRWRRWKTEMRELYLPPHPRSKS